jgi:hypothetical protein
MRRKLLAGAAILVATMAMASCQSRTGTGAAAGATGGALLGGPVGAAVGAGAGAAVGALSEETAPSRE